MSHVDSVTLDVLQDLASELKKRETINSDNQPPPIIQRKEFYWDEIIKWLVAASFGLSFLDVSVEFFRNYTVTCYVPNGTSRDEVAYINNYCLSSLPRSEYFTLFILIHGFLILGPHILWRTVFDASFHFFFDLVSNIDQLREGSSGEYSQKNFEIIHRLEVEYTRPIVTCNRQIFLPKIYIFYLVKLVVQLVVVIGSIIFSISFFDDFSEMFICPTESQQDRIIFDSRKWPITYSVVCVYPSLRFLSLLRYGDIIFLCLIIIVLVYAFFWCLLRHTEELGHKTVAKFCTRSNIPQSAYISTTPLKNANPCTPRIRSDLDFLVLMLFRTSSGRGATFKELQIMREMKRQYHKLSMKIKTPDAGNYNEQSFKSRVHSFLEQVKFHRQNHTRLMAIDVSFDGFGCLFILASWHFQKVCVLNFHSHYRNNKEIVKLDSLYNEVDIITLPKNFFYNPNKLLRQHLDKVMFSQKNLWERFSGLAKYPLNEHQRKECRSDEEDDEDFYINFFTVGPITKDARLTVNSLLEYLKNDMDIANNCLMLTIKPLTIAGINVSRNFVRYKPPPHLFKIEHVQDQNEGGIICYCGDVKCVMEMKIYRYNQQIQ